MLKYSLCNPVAKAWKVYLRFSEAKPKKLKIIEEPKDVPKLIFDQNHRCKVYDFKYGEQKLRKIARLLTVATVFNAIFFGLEVAYPAFGIVNLFSFATTSAIGYMMLGLLQVFSRRTVHRIYLLSDFETVELEFFNAFWKPVTIRVAINEFQEPQPSLYETTRFEITSLGKIWIHETKNEFKNIQDYEDTLEHILFGRPITNLNVKKVLQDAKANRR